MEIPAGFFRLSFVLTGVADYNGYELPILAKCLVVFSESDGTGYFQVASIKY